MDISLYIAPPALGALGAAALFRVFGSMSYVATLTTSPRIEVDFPDAPPPSMFTRPAYRKRF